METMDVICADLDAEQRSLDALVAELPVEAWDAATPAAGWTVRDQISHLRFYDRQAVLAATDPNGFTAALSGLLDQARSGDPSVAEGRSLDPEALLGVWRDGRKRLLEVFGALDPKARIVWYGPAMSAVSFATARLMECWAHGQDVVDALQLTREPTARLRHVAHIGVRARPFSYVVRGLDAPVGDVRVVLAAPGGETWTWGESDTDIVRGSALDFCLVVTQRRHVADTTLAAEGSLATEWMSIAQAFAGPPSEGRPPGMFT